MSEVNLIRRLHQHRSWVNENLWSACAPLTEEELRQEFEIGQGSVWRSLLHLYAAEYVWLEALQGNDDPTLPGDVPGKLPGNQQGQGGVLSMADLKEKWTRLNRRWEAYLEELLPDALDELVYKKSTSSGAGKRVGTRRSDVLLHVCTHAHYTTAQVVHMLRRVGRGSLPEVMMISLARTETAGTRLDQQNPDCSIL